MAHDLKTVYIVVWKQDRSNCAEVFNSRAPAVQFANHIGYHARVVSTSMRGAGYVAQVTGKTSEVFHDQA